MSFIFFADIELQELALDQANLTHEQIDLQSLEQLQSSLITVNNGLTGYVFITVNENYQDHVVKLDKHRLLEIKKQILRRITELESRREVAIPEPDHIKSPAQIENLNSADDKPATTTASVTTTKRLLGVLKQCWADPVWSKVIASGIVGLLALFIGNAFYALTKNNLTELSRQNLTAPKEILPDPKNTSTQQSIAPITFSARSSKSADSATDLTSTSKSHHTEIALPASPATPSVTISEIRNNTGIITVGQHGNNTIYNLAPNHKPLLQPQQEQLLLLINAYQTKLGARKLVIDRNDGEAYFDEPQPRELKFNLMKEIYGSVNPHNAGLFEELMENMPQEYVRLIPAGARLDDPFVISITEAGKSYLTENRRSIGHEQQK